jgi:hypothetical protein
MYICGKDDCAYIAVSIFAEQILVHLHIAKSISEHYSSVNFIINIRMSFRTSHIIKAMCFRPSVLWAKMLQVHKNGLLKRLNTPDSVVTS